MLRDFKPVAVRDGSGKVGIIADLELATEWLASYWPMWHSNSASHFEARVACLLARDGEVDAGYACWAFISAAREAKILAEDQAGLIDGSFPARSGAPIPTYTPRASASE